MDHLLVQSRLLTSRAKMDHFRFLHHDIRWSWRLIGIKGARGVGKTTLMLQRLRRAGTEISGIYLTLDDLHFSNHTLRGTIEYFRERGITHFYLDEVHKYSGWSREIKNIYDLYEDIFVVFTGSSIIELHKQETDLSRRAVLYELPCLSFREYLDLAGICTLAPLSFDDIIKRHETVALELLQHFRPLEHFPAYLRVGCYPFFLEDNELFSIRLKQVIRLILEVDLTTAEGGRVLYTQKIGQLLQIIAEAVPFKPNIQQLAGKVQLDRNTLIRYLHHLENARLIAMLYPEGTTLSALQKPEKIFLQNTNLAFTLCAETPNTGNARETFFYNQVQFKLPVAYASTGDFLVNNRWTVEVGGRTKDLSQIRTLPNSILALDNIELGTRNKIPLWLFGFLY